MQEAVSNPLEAIGSSEGSSDPSDTDRSRRWTTATCGLLVVLVIVGVAVRLHRLGHLGMNHIEVWVPRIELPEYVTNPPQQMSAADVIESTFNRDKHPPGYNLSMLLWNSLFGTGLVAMRTSSVLFGAAALLALYFLARRVADTRVALLAMGLLALHGQHVYWSRQVRPWVLLSLLTIVSVHLLVSITVRWRPQPAAAYVLTVTAGLWIDYYFWPVFAAQALWVILRGTGRPVMPLALKAQCVAFVLSTPVLVFLRFHLGQPSHLDGRFLPHLARLFGFGGLLYTGGMGAGPAVGPWIVGLVALGGGLALVAGVVSQTTQRLEEPGPWQPSPSFVLPMIGAALLASGFVAVAFAPTIGYGRLFAAGVVGPWLLVVVWFFADRNWSLLMGGFGRLTHHVRLEAVCADPVSTVAFGAALSLFALHFFKPIVARYGMLELTPLLLLLTARGMLRLPRGRLLAVAAVVLLCLFSVHQWNRVQSDPHDYKSVAERLRPFIQQGDAILVPNEWWTTAVHYYLKPGEFTLTPPPENRETAARSGLPDRVWIIEFGPDEFLYPRIEAVAARLPDYELEERVLAENAGAFLYLRADQRLPEGADRVP